MAVEEAGRPTTVESARDRGPAGRPAIEKVSANRARELDARINAGLRKLSDALAESYVTIAANLREMYESRAYHHLGVATWEDYLRTKQAFGRTYLSFLLKIGQAGDLTGYLKDGIGASQLVEYARATNYPARIPDLLQQTWPRFKGCSIRELRQCLRGFVQEHQEVFKRPGTKIRKSGVAPWLVRIRSELQARGPAEKAMLLEELRKLVEDELSRDDTGCKLPLFAYPE